MLGRTGGWLRSKPPCKGFCRLTFSPLILRSRPGGRPAVEELFIDGHHPDLDLVGPPLGDDLRGAVPVWPRLSGFTTCVLPRHQPE